MSCSMSRSVLADQQRAEVRACELRSYWLWMKTSPNSVELTEAGRINTHLPTYIAFYPFLLLIHVQLFPIACCSTVFTPSFRLAIQVYDSYLQSYTLASSLTFETSWLVQSGNLSTWYLSRSILTKPYLGSKLRWRFSRFVCANIPTRLRVQYS